MSETNFIKDIVKRPPQLFPLVALFLLFMLGYSVWAVHNAPFLGLEWLQVGWMLGYTVSWIFICLLQRWAAWAYIVIMLLNLLLFLVVSSHSMREIVMSPIFPIDIVFGFFVVFHYKKYS